jgi:hypothetical protein
MFRVYLRVGNMNVKNLLPRVRKKHPRGMGGSLDCMLSMRMYCSSSSGRKCESVFVKCMFSRYVGGEKRERERERSRSARICAVMVCGFRSSAFPIRRREENDDVQSRNLQQ